MKHLKGYGIVVGLSLSVLTSTSAFADLASECRDRSTPERAVTACTKILQRSGVDVDVLQHRGMAHIKLEQFEKAVSDFGAIHFAFPDEPAPLSMLALSLFRADRKAEAVDFYRKLVLLRPEDFTAHYVIGIVAEESNDYIGAATAFEKSISINPDHENARRYLASAYKELERFDDAADVYDSLFASFPDRSVYLRRSIDASVRASAIEDALAKWDRYFDRFEPRRSDFTDLAEIYERSKQYPEALQVYSDALEAFPNEDYLHLQRGLVWDKLGEPTKAIIDYTSALELVPEDDKNGIILALVFRHDAYLLTGDEERAARDKAQALALDPDVADMFD